MNRQLLEAQIEMKKSLLCVGLDTDVAKIPLRTVLEFNKRIIDATHDLVVACKINTAFYEVRGGKGWNEMAETAKYVKKNYPDILVIADAKRGT